MPETAYDETLMMPPHTIPGEVPAVVCRGGQVPGYVQPLGGDRWHCNHCGWVTTTAPLPQIPPLTEVDLTAAALWVLGLRDDPLLQSCYRGALGTWALMLGMDDVQSLAHAETLASASAPVRADVPPF